MAPITDPDRESEDGRKLEKGQGVEERDSDEGADKDNAIPEEQEEENTIPSSSNVMVINGSSGIHIGDVNIFFPEHFTQEEPNNTTRVRSRLRRKRPNDGLEDKSELLFNSCKRIHPVFVPTKAYYYASTSLDQHDVVNILGESGDGKTTLLQKLCLDLHKKGYLIIDVSGPEEIVLTYRKDTKMFFVCDDPFGGPYLIQSKVDSWVDGCSSVTKIPKYIQSGHIKIAFASRLAIWDECKDNLEDLSMFQETVHVSSSKLTYDEKSQMVHKHFNNTVAKPSSDLIDRVAKLDQAIAFPYSCNLLATLLAESSELDEEKFIDTFHRPFPVLRKDIRKISKNTPLGYATLLLVMLSGGSLADDQLTEEFAEEATRTMVKKIFHSLVLDEEKMSLRKLQQCAEKLSSTGTYLVEHFAVGGAKSFVFRHDSIFEAVAIEYGQKHADQLLEYCSPGFIVDRFRLKGCRSLEKSDNDYVSIDASHYDRLTKVLTWEIIAGNVLKVFSNPVVEDELLQQHWIQYLEQLPADARSRFTHTEYVYYFASRKTKLLLAYVLENTKCSQDTEIIRVIYVAAQRRHSGILNLLTTNDVPIGLADDRGRSAFNLAAYLGRHEQVEILLRHGCAVDLEDATNQKTALHYAADRGHEKVAMTLIQNQADVNHSDKDKNGPLHLAACHGHSLIVSTLLTHGADVDKKDHQDSTPLHFAAEHGHAESVIILLDNGACVNHVDKVGKTALHYASKNGHEDVVVYLLGKGADVNHVDFFKKSALDYAFEGDYSNVVSLLDIQANDPHAGISVPGE